MNQMLQAYGRFRSLLAKATWFPPLLARVTVGWVFVESGWGKLHNLPKVVTFFADLGIPAPSIQAPFVATTEFVCGTLVLLGILTRLASIPLIATMAVAILTAKRSEIHEFSDLLGFSEFLYLTLLVWLVVQGAGAVSVDRWLKNRLSRKDTVHSEPARSRSVSNM